MSQMQQGFWAALGIASWAFGFLVGLAAVVLVLATLAWLLSLRDAS